MAIVDRGRYLVNVRAKADGTGATLAVHRVDYTDGGVLVAEVPLSAQDIDLIRAEASVAIADLLFPTYQES